MTTMSIAINEYVNPAFGSTAYSDAVRAHSVGPGRAGVSRSALGAQRSMQLQDVADKIGESMGHLAMDGIAVSQQLLADAIRGAFAFLAAMPIGFPLPSAGATADGEVMLEWWGNRTNSLIVSVSPSGRVAFSSRCYGESINGEFSVARGQLPAAFVLAAQRWWRAGRRDPSSQRV